MSEAVGEENRTLAAPSPGRDRRGRGPRGPWVEPPNPGSALRRSARDTFDRFVLDAVGELEKLWADRLGLIEYAVEDVPPASALQSSIRPDQDTMPLAGLVRGGGRHPSRLVVYRRPIEHRCDTTSELRIMVRRVVFDQVAQLIGEA